MRILDRHKIDYRSYSYDGSRALSGIEVATALGQNPKQVFKTLVTVGKSHQHYVFMIPVAEELDLKKAAAAAGGSAGSCSISPQPSGNPCSLPHSIGIRRRTM